MLQFGEIWTYVFMPILFLVVFFLIAHTICESTNKEDENK